MKFTYLKHRILNVESFRQEKKEKIKLSVDDRLIVYGVVGPQTMGSLSYKSSFLILTYDITYVRQIPFCESRRIFTRWDNLLGLSREKLIF